MDICVGEEERKLLQVDPKVQEFIDKNSDLIKEGKHYEFALKVKALAHRRIQSKRYGEAEMLLVGGTVSLAAIETIEWNICYDMIENLLELYLSHPELLTADSEKRYLKLLSFRKKTDARDIELIRKLAVKCGRPADHPILSQAYLNYTIETAQFHKGQKFAAILSDENAIKFVENWCKDQETKKQQISAIWCRMVLARSVLIGLESGDKLFEKVRSLFAGDDKFLIFTGFLLKTVKMKSKEAYEILHHSYEPFLKEDAAFNSLFKSFGCTFFGVEKQKSSLMSLFQ